jgi:hypothetical protein
MLRRLGPTHLLIGRAKASGCCCFVGDDLGHRPMGCERPALAGSNVAGCGGRFDLPPCAMSWETDHGIPNAGAGSASLAGGIRIGSRTDRYPPSGRCVPWQGCRPVTPFADRLGPLIAPSFEPMPNRMARMSSGKHGHYGRDAQFGELIRMCGIVGHRFTVSPAVTAAAMRRRFSTATRSSPRTGL